MRRGKSDKSINLLTIDARFLQQLLTRGAVTSVELVDAYLAQIKKHDGYLHAMIRTAPRSILHATAKGLGEERTAEKIRGPLHGIPFVRKARIHPSSHVAIGRHVLTPIDPSCL